MNRSLIIASLTCIGVVATAKDVDIPALVRQAKPAVVQIVTYDRQNKPLKTGTGFFVTGDGNLWTNYHVISDAGSIYAKTHSGAVFFLKTIVFVFPDLDVALLRFDATDVPHLSMGSTTDAVEGQRVLVIGNPEGLEGTVSDGLISAFRENRSMIQITAPISPGSSGSPVLDESGQVLGIATLIFKEGQNLNFAISADAIREAITKAVAVKSPSDQQQQPAKDQYDRAENELAHENYQTAIADFTQAIRLRSDYADAYHGRGIACAHLKQLHEAIVDFTEAIRLHPGYTAAYYNRGIVYSQLNQDETALRDFDEAIKLEPNNASAFYNRGISHENLNQHDRAIGDYTEAIRLQPDNAPAYNNRGIVYGKLSQYETAVADFTEAIRTKPDNADAYANRGLAYKSLKQYDKAIRDYSDSLRLRPNDAGTYFDRAVVYTLAQDYERAISDWSQVILAEPTNPSAYNYRGYVYKRLKQYNKAIDDFTKAIGLKPNYLDAYVNRSDAYAALKATVQAEQDLIKAREIKESESR